MHRYFYFLIIMTIFTSVQAHSWTLPLPTFESINSDYVSADIDGDYMAVERQRSNRDAVVFYQVPTATTTTIDDGTNSSYCQNTLPEENETDPYDTTACDAWPDCDGVFYSNVNIEGNYVTFVKTTSTYTCRASGYPSTYSLSTSSSSYEIGVYNISSGNLSSISASESVSNLGIDGNNLIWIENKDVKMYDMSTGTGTATTVLN